MLLPRIKNLREDNDITQKEIDETKQHLEVAMFNEKIK